MQHQCRHLTKPFPFWPDSLNSLALLASIRGLIDFWRDRPVEHGNPIPIAGQPQSRRFL
jgi:hypothetical protein